MQSCDQRWYRRTSPRKLAEESAAELAIPAQARLFDDAPNRPKRNPWAWLPKKVFLVDVTECPDFNFPNSARS
jgi:hypothetical protein